MELSTELRHLEGESAMRSRMAANCIGRASTPVDVAFACSCISHGRLLWDSASKASLETRPMLLYYGASSFAKALVVATGLANAAEVSRVHGMSAKWEPDEALRLQRAVINKSGLFQQFNDVVAPASRLCYSDEMRPASYLLPADLSTRLKGLSPTLEETLCRIPSISSSWEMCTGRPAKSIAIDYFPPRNPGGYDSIEVRSKNECNDIDSLRALVTSIRERAPFLKSWRTQSVSAAYGGSVVEFASVEIQADVDEFAGLVRLSEPIAPADRDWERLSSVAIKFDGRATIPLLSGGVDPNLPIHFVEQIEGTAISEYSVAFLALFSLGMLVRYRPHVWTSCVYRRDTASDSADDMYLPVIEDFLAFVDRVFPSLVVETLL